MLSRVGLMHTQRAKLGRKQHGQPVPSHAAAAAERFTPMMLFIMCRYVLRLYSRTLRFSWGRLASGNAARLREGLDASQSELLVRAPWNSQGGDCVK